MKTQSLIITLLFLVVSVTFAQDKVLVFTKTNGFTHPSIGAGVTMITNLGNSNGLWTTDETDNANDFNANNLAQYKAVIWCNTSGNNLLNASQRQAFEDFIADGGGFLGIHAATDTYRNGSWPFYNELVGAIVQTNPNHTSNNFNATMTVQSSHPSVDFLNGGTWEKKEEYYYWKINGGFLYSGNIDLLEVESTGSNSYDEARPISWYKEYMGGRSFYTALGHNSSDYTNNNNFIKHVEEGIKYVIGNTLSVGGISENPIKVIAYPNPTTNFVKLSFSGLSENVTSFNISDSQGKIVFSQRDISTTMDNYSVSTKNWPAGVYFVQLNGSHKKLSFKLLKN